MVTTVTVAGRTYTYSHCIAWAQAFRQPMGIVMGRNGVVYVPCRGGERTGFMQYQRWTKWSFAEDKRILEVGEYGTEDGNFVWPSGLGLDKEETVYVADEWLNRISIFSNDGKFLKKWGTPGSSPGQLDGPAGMRFDSQDTLFISESRNNRIQKFTKDGKYISTLGHKGSGPGEFSMPFGMNFDSQGYLYVADWGNDRVQKLTSDGEFVAQFGKSGSGEGELTRPTDVAIDRDGDIYVADWGNNRVQVFDAKGNHVHTFVGDADQLSNSAQQFINANPDYVKARRRADTTIERYFRRPIAIAIDDKDRVLIVENVSGRIQIYQKERDYVDPQFNL